MKTSTAATRLMPTLMCAWCKHVMRPGSPKVSHGICRPCTVRWFGKLRRAVPRVRGPLPA